MSIKDINDVYEIRTSLEVLAAGLAAERIAPEQLEEMQYLLIQIQHGIDEDNMDKIVDNDVAFHDVLYRASGNERLRNIINNLREQLTGIRRTSMLYPGRLKDTQEEHRALVDAIAQHDVEKSQEAARVHLENAERTLMASTADAKKAKKA